MITVLDADSCRPSARRAVCPPQCFTATAASPEPAETMDVDTDGLPTDDVIAIPVPSPEDRPAYFAVIAATHVARPRAEQRQVAALLAHLAAQSLTAA